ncbi:PH domain-containing protein [Amycolatopsis saalfeldensis]|uniref:PH domain-containing protein n=1 Tax=Amycolatopsis saalfeldensis TaxID=394193 RepID=A0A1H8XVS0_9PSEU|nr:PH domain-containing protein [Amycolatopsis saalfeldensis]SEP43852.1 PH domain-containing protein [Amycolatopsis saalfeldensis]
MTDQQTATLVIRPRRTLIMCSVLAVLLLGVFIVVAVLLRNSHTGVVFEPADQAAMIGIGILLAAGTMLFALPRVRADADGVEVRNVLATRRFAWTDVLSVSFPDGASWARFELPEDEYFSVMAVQAVDRDRAVAAVRALRKLHRAAHEAA